MTAASSIGALCVSTGWIASPRQWEAADSPASARATYFPGSCPVSGSKASNISSRPQTCLLETPRFPFKVSPVVQVAQLIGSTPNGRNARYDPYPHSINDTTRWRLCRGDLGSLMVSQGVGYVALGDNYSDCANGRPGRDPPVWRSNAVGIIGDPGNFVRGLYINRWVSRNGKTAAQVIPSAHNAGDCQATQFAGCEVTTIPTYSFAVAGHLFLAFMSVHHWGQGGAWQVNYSSFTMSPDHGRTWRVERRRIHWGANSNFAQVAIAPDPRGKHLLFYGIPAGLFGQVELMRAPDTVRGVLSRRDYQYFAGTADGRPRWTINISRAATVTNGLVGELSVIYDPGLKHWLMTDLEGNTALVMRTSVNYWGPWSQPQSIATQGDFPGLYGAFMEPHFLTHHGHTVYFVMSRFGPYRIYWMKITVTPD